jgi:integrase
MARGSEKLSPAKVEKTKAPGLYGDGRGLYLHVGPSGGKSWIFRYLSPTLAPRTTDPERRKPGGKPREMGLGPYPDVGLARAREKAAACRALRADGIDPLEAQNAERARKAAEAAAAKTFKQCAEEYITANRAGWKNAKHAAQWQSTLSTYVYPTIGKLAVGAIEIGHITKVLQPIWSTKPETATRVRGRIESVLDFAKVNGWRTGENPARWKGHLDHVLLARRKVAEVKHHAAMAWEETGAFMGELEKQEGTAALVLRFLILTATRTNEAIAAQWGEIDLQAAVWTIPAERMKAKRKHRVPLSAAALAVLGEAAKLRATDAPDTAPVFPGARTGKPLSNMALLMLLRRMGRDDVTAHGFRSSFRDWAGENGQPDDIAEMALAHTLGKVQEAYKRSDLLDRRRPLMDAWAALCGRVAPPKDGNVVELRGAA